MRKANVILLWRGETAALGPIIHLAATGSRLARERLHIRSSSIALTEVEQFDGRNRLTNFWTPTQKKKDAGDAGTGEDGHDLLARAGFLRQAKSGIFHLLPLGLRVQDKIERLIDKHMTRLGAAKLSLSSLSSQDLWQQSGRLDGRNQEFFQLEDRRGIQLLLSPTHEEEITTIVKNAVHSYRDLPLRLYQVSRKYRDEARPRQGLLRGREFLMKDLYTFDVSEAEAMQTYDLVRAAYRAFLDDIRLPYLVANADSGNMGGTHSHEYHFASPSGEDTIITCNNCDLSINEELYIGSYTGKPLQAANVPETQTSTPFQIWCGRITKPALEQKDDTNGDRDGKDGKMAKKSLVQIFLPSGPFEVNLHAVKQLVPALDTTFRLSQEEMEEYYNLTHEADIISFRDPRVSEASLLEHTRNWSTIVESPMASASRVSASPFLLSKVSEEDPCPSCGSHDTLHLQRAVEIGHTFHLGTRYSRPFEATVQNDSNEQVAMQMGCHGIGISRLIGAAASLLADDKGLNWPIAIAPFGVVLLGTGSTPEADVSALYDYVGLGLAGSGLDAIIDDRNRTVGWKLNDADLVGYPFVVVLGKAWRSRKAVELQCRRLGVKEEVSFEQLVPKIQHYREKL